MNDYELDQKFLLVWDMYGLEAIVDLSLQIQEEVEHKLKEAQGTPKEFTSTINFWMLRARCNPHRNYEIYAVTVPEDVTKEMLAEWFNESPQTFANLIRLRGIKLHGLKNAMEPVIR